ncbi:MAG: hypothetical protein DI535_12105 [Citrobacter freundii]|nr:MAG: hypothetical protein DI535_12105 [Citrobacter freundii]
MSDNISKPTFDWLRTMKVNISREFVKRQLQCHPDFPSLASLTERLEEWGIPSAAVVVDKEKLHELPLPFLAHQPENDGGFILVKSFRDRSVRSKEFLSSWDGIAVFAEAPDNWRYSSNDEQLKKDNILRRRKIASFILSALAIAGIVSTGFSWPLTILLVSSLLGIGVASLIVQEELGITNEITEQLCSTGKQVDCNAVLNSDAGKVGTWFKLSDASLVYFAGLSLFVMLTYLVPAASSWLPWLVFSAIPVTIFSLYYQWRVIGKWCILCLLIVGILWLQAGVVLVGITPVFSLNLSTSGSALIIFSMIFPAVAWMMLKPLLKKQKNFADKRFALQRFKHTKDVFYSLLVRQRKVSFRYISGDIQIGNPQARIQLFVACNPYCAPCAKAHEALHRIIERTDIGLTIRFSTRPDDDGDPKTIAAEYILGLMEGCTTIEKRHIIKDWYEVMNIDQFKRHYPSAKQTDAKAVLWDWVNWVAESGVEFTPTIYVNGYQLPRQYRVEDLEHLVHTDDEPGLYGAALSLQTTELT